MALSMHLSTCSRLRMQLLRQLQAVQQETGVAPTHLDAAAPWAFKNVEL